MSNLGCGKPNNKQLPVGNWLYNPFIVIVWMMFIVEDYYSQTGIPYGNQTWQLKIFYRWMFIAGNIIELFLVDFPASHGSTNQRVYPLYPIPILLQSPLNPLNIPSSTCVYIYIYYLSYSWTSTYIYIER